MRILQVRFKNLNSLSGEWSIDFTHPSYASDGIFAITGPTGAGKTTILDAICLALYGRTPRLEKVTKSANEIMSRQTGECFAEVTFETGEGRFRCHFGQHRARRKAGGDLQPAKHEIADADSGKILESKIRDVARRIERATGMDFDRFTRSMLLAQGGFAAFLSAQPDERAPILEQITGTAIYSSISIKVHELRAEEEKKLKSLQAELAGMELLSEEQKCDLSQTLKESEEKEKALGLQLKELSGSLALLERISGLEKERDALAALQKDFLVRSRAFRPQRERLEMARKALGLEGDYAGIEALRGQQQKELVTLDKNRKTLPGQEKALAEADQKQGGSQANLAVAKKARKTAGQSIKQVREMDTRIKEKNAGVTAAAEALKVAGAQQVQEQKRIKTVESSRQTSVAALSATEHYLADHAVDAGLVAEYSAIGKTFDAFRQKAEENTAALEARSDAAAARDSAVISCVEQETAHEKRNAELKKAESTLAALRREIATLRKDRDAGQWRDALDDLKERCRLLEDSEQTLERIEQAKGGLSAVRARRGNLNDENRKLQATLSADTKEKESCEKDVDHLEKQVELLSRIRSLEQDRARLADGSPCPLCGATDHPYAAGNTPQMDETETALKKAKKSLGTLTERLNGLAVKKARLGKDIQQADLEEAKLAALLAEEEGKFENAFRTLSLDTTGQERLGAVLHELAATRKKTAHVTLVIADAEKKAKEEETSRIALEKMRSDHAKSERALQRAVHDRKSAEKEHRRQEKDCALLCRQTENAAIEAKESAAVYGAGELSAETLDATLKKLAGRRDAWLKHQQQKSDCEKKIAQLNSELSGLRALQEKLAAEIGEKQAARKQLSQAQDLLCQKRFELFGDKDPDKAEKNLEETVENAETALTQAQENRNALALSCESLKERIASLADAVSIRKKELDRSVKAFAKRIEPAGFEDEAAFRAACLSEAARDELAKKEEALRREETELATRTRDIDTNLSTLRETKVTGESEEKLRQALSALETAIREIRLETGAIGSRLQADDSLKQSQRLRVEKIDAQKKECERWGALHELIGSADGKKFRNFAQGLTFAMMISHANRQLEKMTDRYLLMTDTERPLELSVIDSYQAGEVRSTKNLSGGESFIVSLALALGLSRMASRNVRVDSLFLDEGFGTLDDEALETALTTLAGLRQEGKLIGVISHVPALKERIGTQLQVTPRTGGRSAIEGPGCTQKSG